MFDAGTPESRNATLGIAGLTKPTAWIDTYYPLLDTPRERKLEILREDGSIAWSADLEEKEDDLDEAAKYAKAVGAWHAFSKHGDVKVCFIHGSISESTALTASLILF